MLTTTEPPSIPQPPTPETPPDPPPLPPLEERLRRLSETEALGERIAELAAHISAANYQLLLLIREFDQRGGWACGFNTCAHWLSWRTGLAIGAAREKVRVAKALAELPKISEAMRTAELSYSKARALTRIANPDNEERLLQLALHGTASQVERFVRAWRQVDRNVEAERNEAATLHASRYLDLRTDDTGMIVVRGRLDPEAGAVLERALEMAAEVLYQKHRPDAHLNGDRPNVGQRRADALGVIAEAALDSGLGDDDVQVDTRADRYQVVVHVDRDVIEDPAAPGVSEIEGAGSVPAETSRRLACDASTVTMTHDSEGAVLDVGRRTRVLSAALRRALAYRDKRCRFPGCQCRHCEAHHVHHWAAGGETKLDNLVLLCRRHHRGVHEEGLRVEEDDTGGFIFRQLDGRVIEEAPRTPRVADDPFDRLSEELVEAGVLAGELDHYPKWDGSRLKLAFAIDRLWSEAGE